MQNPLNRSKDEETRGARLGAWMCITLATIVVLAGGCRVSRSADDAARVGRAAPESSRPGSLVNPPSSCDLYVDCYGLDDPAVTQPTTSEPPTTNPGTSADTKERARQELDHGKVAYNPPAQMRLEETVRVEMRITRDPSERLGPLPGPEATQIETLPVGMRMKGELRSSDFDVTPLSPELQLFWKTGFRSWSWWITPKRTDHERLKGWDRRSRTRQ